MHSNEDSMQKIFSVMEYLSDQGRKLSIQEISAALDMSTATVYRILTGLKSLGYVEQHTNKQYYLTYKLFALSGEVINRNGAVDRITPIMNYLSLRYECEVGLTAFDESSIIHIISVGENISFRMQPVPGQVCPAYCTASGKYCLAQMEDEALGEWISKARLVPHTRNTIIDRNALFREIMRTRKQGYGVAVGELYDTLASVAVPIRNGEKDIIGTLNLNFSVDRFQSQISDQFISEVQDTLKHFGV